MTSETCFELLIQVLNPGCLVLGLMLLIDTSEVQSVFCLKYLHLDNFIKEIEKKTKSVYRLNYLRLNYII